jgi:demethylmenaquinone methyltransferase/2-methoxy-6-polyprenyl-1,4-benzoquinol methylase
MTKTEMTEYYAKRSSEYERIYHKPERQKDLKELQTTISGSFRGLNVLEIACGTGYWTQFACRSAKSIVATDYNEEVLAIAREKDYGDCPITFVKSDAYVLDEVNGPFSAALVGFWWSHIPNSKLGGFLQVLHSKLSKGAAVIMMDNRYVESSSTPISRMDDEGNAYQIRQLSDGSTHEVLKNFPSQDDFTRRIKLVAEGSCFTILDYFWLAQYRVKGSTERIRIDRESEAIHDLSCSWTSPPGFGGFPYIGKYLFSKGRWFQPGRDERFLERARALSLQRGFKK